MGEKLLIIWSSMGSDLLEVVDEDMATAGMIMFKQVMYRFGNKKEDAEPKELTAKEINHVRS